MSNSLKGSWAWAAIIISTLIIPVAAIAAEIRTGESPTLSATETVNNDLYLLGGNISSGGTVVGDLVIGGGNVSVNGPVSQDALIGGGSIAILSDVGDDLRVAGGNISIAGKVGKDIVVAGGQTQISGSVGRDVVWAGGALAVNAPVGGKMQLKGGEVVINSHVSGNVIFTGNKLTLGKDAVIDGNLDYAAASEATIETGAVVKGKTTFTQLTSPAKSPITKEGIIAILSALFLGKFLAALLFALVLGLLFKRFAFAVVASAAAHPFQEIGRGFIVLIVLPIASVIALVTLIGIPFGVLGLLLFGALMLTASAWAAVLLGAYVYKKFYKQAEYQLTWQTILLGVLIYTLLGLIPVLGGLAKFVLVLIVLGSSAKIVFEGAKSWR
ncbi:MAG: hypothetical protein Q7S01_02165 [bacterium]|nr:hypothetical protein [bacterium]